MSARRADGSIRGPERLSQTISKPFQSTEAGTIGDNDSSITRAAVEEWLGGAYPEIHQDIQVYHRFNRLKFVFIIACIIVAFITAGYALSIGEYDLSFMETYSLLWHHILGDVPEELGIQEYVVWTLRAPRVLGGLLAGAALSVGGVMMQGLLKNPLADTYTTGISSGASLGATLAICAGRPVLLGGQRLHLLVDPDVRDSLGVKTEERLRYHDNHGGNRHHVSLQCDNIVDEDMGGIGRPV